MTRAVQIHATGGPEVMTLVEGELPPPGPGEARVRHEAIGLNFIDTYHRTGLYPLPLPHGVGVAGAGVVEAIGDGVTEVGVGDRVAYGNGPPGSYADARLLAARFLVPIPEGVGAEDAAAVMVPGMTVEYLVRRTYEVRPGTTVLLHAAAGGVGLLACQWLADLGARVIGTVGTDAKAELARAHGCAETIVYTREDFVARVRELTDGAGVSVVYDSVGRATLRGSLECLRPRGLLVAVGNASGPPEPLDVLELARRGSLYVTRPRLGDYVGTREELTACAAEVLSRVASGALRVHVGQRFPLEEAAAAHRALESRQTVGATALRPAP